MRSREISRNSNMWHNFHFSIWLKCSWRGKCWKPHLNRSGGSKVMSNWRILRTTENNTNSFLFLAISHNQCSRLPTDSAGSQLARNIIALSIVTENSSAIVVKKPECLGLDPNMCIGRLHRSGQTSSICMKSVRCGGGQAEPKQHILCVVSMRGSDKLRGITSEIHLLHKMFTTMLEMEGRPF